MVTHMVGWQVGPSKCLIDEGVDYLVIGSGFGGSVAAATLAEKVDDETSVCLFERGKAYPPGSFPRKPQPLNDNFWVPESGKHGLFQFWKFSGLDAITASGLGGGSLIYANVMLEKPREWFIQPTPDGQSTEKWSFDYDDLADHYRGVFDVLKFEPIPQEFIGTKSLKTQRFLDASPDARLAPLAVRFRDGTNPAVDATLPDETYGNIHGKVKRTTCHMVGECDVGCNAGAKSSMDHTYLSMAASAGAKICVRTEVQLICRCDDGDGYLFNVGFIVHHDGDDDGRTDSRLQWIKAKRVVMAAGALNSTYLMLSNLENLKVPPSQRHPFGRRFCGNGDLLGFAVPPPNGEALLPSGGPVITAYQQFDTGEHRMLLQDGGLPNLRSWKWTWNDIRKLFEHLFKKWWADTMRRSQGLAPASQDLFPMPKLHWPLPLLGMGADKPDGILELENGELKCRWTVETSRPYFNEVFSRMQALSERLATSFYGNPQWKLKRVITVHPLGGCPADTTAEKGVVDSYGRVHSVPGLWIADGSVMPGPIGANPSLTIAAFARRAACKLLEEGLETPSTPEPFIRTD